MDLARLTRPAILCQCSRCSSSLAALENEWAKLSNSYSVAAGWLSVELHRISISPERKQIPQSSDLSILRGRILQEIACKLCQQKLGVLCALDNGPNIFWKLSKVSFREIVTMRTVEPSFKDGALEQLLSPASAKRDRTSTQPGALAPLGAAEIDYFNTSVEQQMQHQGLSIDHISNSVNNLHDTMSELKSAFTALRIELNGPNRTLEAGNLSTSDFNMIATVLKELKNKADENEKLKLENAGLKLRNQLMTEQAAKMSIPIPTTEEEFLPEVRSPGLLQAGRKRQWPEAFSGGHSQPIADSFDEYDDDADSMADFSLTTPNGPSVKIPVKEPERAPAAQTTHQHPRPESPSLRIEVNNRQSRPPARAPSENMVDRTRPANSSPTQQDQPMQKRQRLNQPAEADQVNGTSEKSADKRRGRPRKSISQPSNNNENNPDTQQTPKTTEQPPPNNTSNQPERIPLNTSPKENQNAQPGRPRSLRNRSRPPSARQSGAGADTDTSNLVETPSSHPAEKGSTDTPNESGKENPNQSSNSKKPGRPKSNSNVGTTDPTDKNNHDSHEKRKAQMSRRDTMARMAMQREEAMETEDSR